MKDVSPTLKKITCQDLHYLVSRLWDCCAESVEAYKRKAELHTAITAHFISCEEGNVHLLFDTGEQTKRCKICGSASGPVCLEHNPPDLPIWCPSKFHEGKRDDYIATEPPPEAK